MRILYNFFIQAFQLGLNISSLFGNKKAKSWKKGRVNLFQRLQKSIPKNKEIIWFHCASVGEFEQARPLLEKIKEDQNYFILLTFFSPSGYEARKNYSLADHVDYLPLDTPSNAKRFIETINPKLSFFAKYEFWFNILNELNQANHSHFLISGIFRKKQQFFRFYGKWFRKHLEHFSHLYLQDQSSKTLLESFGINHCSISGDGRFDRVDEIAKEDKKIAGISEFIQEKDAIIFGSSWEKENELAFQLANRIQDIKIIMAPHEFHKEEIEKLRKKYKIAISYYSDHSAIQNSSQILLIDQMGMLASLYKYGTAAVIGGGFKKGIHNILEAAVYGMPIFFGPKYSFFKEAWDLLEVGGAKVFKNEEEFHLLIQEVLTDQIERLRMAQVCKDYFQKNIGSTNLIYNHLKENNYLT